jgi:DNA mismatch endonuclease (patch repair protein)
MPKTREAFWKSKFEANVRCDAKVRRELKREGWHVLVIWECETQKRDLVRLQSKLLQFLYA